MLTNYIPINRKLFEHLLWTEKRPFSKFEAWLDLIREARFENGEATALIGGKLIKWTRGEVPVSLRYLADKWSWSKNKVDDYLRMLENERMILKRTQEGTSQTIVMLCNYECYNKNEKKEGQQTGRARDSEGTARGQPRDKSNKGNKEKESKEGKEDAIAYPFVSDEFKNLWKDWKEYRLAEFKSSYKSIKSEQTALIHLKNISQNNEIAAREIIQTTMGNHYQGFFALKKQINGSATYSTVGKTFEPD